MKDQFDRAYVTTEWKTRFQVFLQRSKRISTKNTRDKVLNLISNL